jgi:hypothetical protein
MQMTVRTVTVTDKMPRVATAFMLWLRFPKYRSDVRPMSRRRSMLKTKELLSVDGAM